VIHYIFSFSILISIVILRLKYHNKSNEPYKNHLINSSSVFLFSFGTGRKKILVEVFTNSHCPLCPTAHNVIDNYLAGPNGNKISYIYYHMVYPYNYDLLYLQSQEGSDARDNYYNPVSATPQGWFDGTHQGSSSEWTTSLDNLVLLKVH
jgi:hypothetical protein